MLMAEMKARLRAVRGLLDILEEEYKAQPVLHYKEIQMARAPRHSLEVLDEQEQRLDRMEETVNRLERERQVYD
jgi:hypothetical protein